MTGHTRHIETLAQIAHADHVAFAAVIAWDRCEHALCRASREAVAALTVSIPLADERLSEIRQMGADLMRGDILEAFEELIAEVSRLHIPLTDQEHELRATRAELLRWQRMGGAE